MQPKKDVQLKQASAFGRYYRYLDDMDREWKTSNEFGSILILSFYHTL